MHTFPSNNIRITCLLTKRYNLFPSVPRQGYKQNSNKRYCKSWHRYTNVSTKGRVTQGEKKSYIIFKQNCLP